MTDEEYLKASSLRARKKALEEFMEVISPLEGRDDKNYILIKEKVTTKKEYSLFGYRWYGCGARTGEIKVPVCVFDDVKKSVKNQIEECTKELEEM